MRLLTFSAAVASALLACAAPSRAGDLPPPPAPTASALALQAPVTLYLELVVNQQRSGQVVPVRVRDGHYLVAAEVLRARHVRTDMEDMALVAVDQIEGVSVRYDSVNQRLALDLPPHWLPAQTLGQRRTNNPYPTLPGEGVVLNYDAYASNLGQHDASTAVWTEQRWFGEHGVLSNTGVLRHSAGGTLHTARNGYLRYDTTWRRAEPDLVRTTTVGDLITGTLPWGRAVRIGGIQIARSFAIRPDLVPFPLPSFAGEAAVPSAVDLFINGQRAGREQVQPGPFTLNTMPFINGAGVASVVTTDALGRQVQTQLPFYVASNLLKTGHTDYSLAAGALRRGYGVESFSYGRVVASGNFRYGLNDSVTLETRGELARGLSVAGVGAVGKLGRLGVVQAALAHGGSGHQWNLGYQYQAPRFGLTVQHQQHSAGWRDLSVLERHTASPYPAQDMVQRHRPGRSTQATASVSLGRAGSLALGYVDGLQQDGQRTRLATASWSRSVGRHSFVSAHLNGSLDRRTYTAQLQWTLMLGQGSSISTQAARTRDSTSTQLLYQRTPPADGGLGWNVAYGHSQSADDFRQASATWRASAMQLEGGVQAQGGRSASWAGASGALVAMDGGWFAANRIHDAFALVATGVPGVPVRHENQTIGRTDARGHLLVTGVSAYYPARFEIDTLELPDFMRVERPEQRALLRAGSGGLLRFDIRTMRAASITLHDAQGQALPVGAQVQHVGSGRRTTMGWGGQVYLEDLADDNELVVRSSPADSCRVRFALPRATPGVVRIGPLVCRAALATAQLADRPSIP